MSAPTILHGGCRACGRTDVQLTKKRALREHVHIKDKGSSFLRSFDRRCNGSGHPPKGVLGPYATKALELLREHFRDLEDPLAAELVGEAIQQYLVVRGDLHANLDRSGDWQLTSTASTVRGVWVVCRKTDPEPGDEELAEKITHSLTWMRGK